MKAQRNEATLVGCWSVVGSKTQRKPSSNGRLLFWVEVIATADHFQNGWKSFIHFQRVASGRADAVASGVTSNKTQRQKLLIQPFNAVVATTTPMIFQAFSELFANVKTA